MKKKVIARLYLKNEFIESFKRNALVLIQETRKEKGCLLYSLYQDCSNPSEFLFYEEYASQEAVDIHFKSEYLKTFSSTIAAMQSKDHVVDVI